MHYHQSVKVQMTFLNLLRFFSHSIHNSDRLYCLIWSHVGDTSGISDVLVWCFPSICLLCLLLYRIVYLHVKTYLTNTVVKAII